MICQNGEPGGQSLTPDEWPMGFERAVRILENNHSPREPGCRRQVSEIRSVSRIAYDISALRDRYVFTPELKQFSL
jgi:hypothetical protein